MKVGVIIQARVGSTRLPGKVLKEICGKTVLSHVIERVRQSKLINCIVVATTTLKKDDEIENEAIKCGVKVFRGSEEDVLERYFLAAKENELDVVVRITSDCPLIDSKVIDKMMEFYLSNNYDVVTNGGSDKNNRTYPRGLDTEIFSFAVLKNCFDSAETRYHREHVTPYMYEKNTEVYYYKNTINYSKYRWTLDTLEDFMLIELIYAKLYKKKHDFYLNDIIALFKSNPEIFKINAHVEQKRVG